MNHLLFRPDPYRYSHFVFSSFGKLCCFPSKAFAQNFLVEREVEHSFSRYHHHDMTQESAETTPLTGKTLQKPSANCDGGYRTTLSVLGILILAGTIVVAHFRWQPFSSSGSTHVEDDDWMPQAIVSDYTMPISIFNSNNKDDAQEIQHLVDTSLMECFGFDFTEAQATSRKAISLLSSASDCPMCFWVLAMTYAPFINHPKVSNETYHKAAEAAEHARFCAQRTAQKLTEKERGLIKAIHLRFNTTYGNQTQGYEDYRSALDELYQKMPHDPDILAFLADAIMVLHCDGEGYHFYQNDNRNPKPSISLAISLLEDCLSLSSHPLCRHLYIHITEPSLSPEKALSTANNLNLAAQTSQAQHLQHMPGHTYYRVGRYHDAVLVNIQAHKSDQAFLDHNHLPYGPAHNLAFLVQAAQTSGETQTAYYYADVLRTHYTRFPDQRDGPGPEMGWHIWRTVRLRMGDYRAVLLDADDMPREWPYAQLLGHYSKGVAVLVTSQKAEEAAQHWEALQSTLPLVAENLQPVAAIANLTLAASLEYWKGNIEESLQLFREARIQQESWAYTEPPDWFMTMAQCEATLLRQMGQMDEAVELFLHDLQNVPENRQSLFGLWKTLVEAGGDERVIQDVRLRYTEAARWADDPNLPPNVCPQLGE